MQAVIDRAMGLDNKTKISAAVSTVAVAGVLALTLPMALKPQEALLFAGLDSKTAGEITLALDGEGVDYEVRGERIYVPAKERDRLRLSLAQQNLPGAAGEGYELLDSLDGFSTTSEMFNVTYWRAKEGELARTLLAMPNVTAARVHIGTEERSPFGRRREERTASVTLTTSSMLSAEQLRAVRHLMALSVPGMLPENVAVVDTVRGLLHSDAENGLSGGSAAKEIEGALLTMLEARLGAGNARVNVALESVRKREEIASSTVDPDRTAVLSRSREENKRAEEGSAGAVTIASDLPTGETGEEDGPRTTDEGVREDVTYAVSTTNRKVELLPGGIERLSVAVLINEAALGEAPTNELREAELASLRTLIATAAGIRPERGDVVTLEAMAFDLPEEAAGTPPAPAQKSPFPLLPAAGVGVAALLFLLFVLRPLLGRKKPAADGAIIGDLSMLPADTATGTDLTAPVAEPQALPAPAEDPVGKLREQSAKRPEDAAALLNSWLDQKETAA
ncbi:flagellar basal-body MS-ring/collar protein FliF [Parvularcula maris]|uniref:Flagellar M-ring protein n=1 Tax=Parvularcula maris TaxID=2965077 RepID=A0A9X2RGN3_9PROT|nr:flagellar basal-body MS-ring/collar protein FliF [Parvularcula maris]MCQ8184064.1 flagellar M-ring protein FliF [Parvularcula maris]